MHAHTRLCGSPAYCCDNSTTLSPFHSPSYTPAQGRTVPLESPPLAPSSAPAPTTRATSASRRKGASHGPSLGMLAAPLFSRSPQPLLYQPPCVRVSLESLAHSLPTCTCLYSLLIQTTFQAAHQRSCKGHTRARTHTQFVTTHAGSRKFEGAWAMVE